MYAGGVLGFCHGLPLQRPYFLSRIETLLVFSRNCGTVGSAAS